MEEIGCRLGSSSNEVQAEEKRGLAEGYIHIHGPLATATAQMGRDPTAGLFQSTLYPSKD